MIKRLVFLFIALVVFYVFFVQVQIVITRKAKTSRAAEKPSEKPAHKVYSFQFTKYTPEGQKEIEIEGDSADILTNTVQLMNVMAKAYAEEVPVTVTADRGENEVNTQVKKDNINVEGLGARADTQLKKVKFKKNVTVIVQNPDEKEAGPTTITCDGPLLVDYDKNIAHFKDNVVAQDNRGKLTADTMDVYYNRVSRRVSKIVAVGSVVIQNPEGNKTFSDSVIYLADEGRIILGGDTEALYYGGEESEKNLEKGII